MVFAGDTMSQDSNVLDKTVGSSPNAMTWCDRTRKSITAVYVTFPNSSEHYQFGRKGGLVSNSFSCQVIGRW